jgi:transposase
LLSDFPARLFPTFLASQGMAARFVPVSRDTPMFLPLDLTEWIPKDDPVRLVIEAVQHCSMNRAQINHRGSGDRQYPPDMMLALLIYCYAHRIFSSRQIEQATYTNVSVRYLCDNHHPDHDTIATFRRQNGPLLEDCFLSVLEMARITKALRRLGVVSVDGTKLQARASRNANRTGAELEEHISALQLEIKGLVQEAERADVAAARPGQAGLDRLAPELLEPEQRCERLRAAKAELEARQAAQRAARRQREHDPAQPGPEEPSPPSCPPRGGAQAAGAPAEKSGRPTTQAINLVDPDSRLMRDAHGHYLQAYNAQFVVDAGGSQLILGAHVTAEANDRRSLPQNLESVPASYRPEITHVVADTGYDNADLIAQVERDHGVCVLCPPQSPGTPKLGKTYRCTKVRQRRLAQAQAMREKLEQPEQKARYRRRSATVEPVIGVLKNVLGFRRFRLFGQAKTQLELTLLATAYNLRRLGQMAAAARA